MLILDYCWSLHVINMDFMSFILIMFLEYSGLLGILNTDRFIWNWLLYEFDGYAMPPQITKCAHTLLSPKLNAILLPLLFFPHMTQPVQSQHYSSFCLLFPDLHHFQIENFQSSIFFSYQPLLPPRAFNSIITYPWPTNQPLHPIARQPTTTYFIIIFIGKSTN